MNVGEYQKLALRTNAQLKDYDEDVLHMKLGILTEIGELLDILKKNIAYQKPIDPVHIREEIADVCWYIVNLATINKIELDYLYTEEDFRGDHSSTSQQIGGWIVDELPSLFFSGNIKEPFFYYSFLGALYAIACEMKVDFNLGLELNIKKLEQRYPEKFTVEKAENRDLEAERKILENN